MRSGSLQFTLEQKSFLFYFSISIFFIPLNPNPDYELNHKVIWNVQVTEYTIQNEDVYAYTFQMTVSEQSADCLRFLKALTQTL